jgi:hydrogenase nickel incorporation protein HypA/HybF
MHELSVCLSLLDQVRAIAAERGASRVTRIELKIGPLSGIERDLLLNAWPLASAGTLAVDAEIIVDESEVVVRCNTCGAESTAQPNRLVCGKCGDFRTVLQSGDEMILERLELDSAPA